MRVVEDQIVTIASCNQEMSDAIDQARASINQFFAAFQSPSPTQNSFLLKARFDDHGYAEHIWLADLDFTSQPATGVVANEPAIPTLTYLERVPFQPAQISDWMYMDAGRLVGAFTTRVLLRHAAQHDLKSLRQPTYKM